MSPSVFANKGYEQIVSATLASSVGLASIPTGASWCTIQCEAVDVRWRDDGTAPTSTVGSILAAGSVLPYYGELSRLQFIRTAAGSILNVSYYA